MTVQSAIRTIALNGIGDFGTQSQISESIENAYGYLRSLRLTSRQIQSLLVKCLESLDVEFWHRFQNDQTVLNQQNAYAIRERLNKCANRLRLMQAH